MASSITQVNDVTVMSGRLDETTDFRALSHYPGLLKIDLAAVIAINSVATSRFIQLAQDRAGFSMEYHRCPEIFIQALNSIPRLLGPKEDARIVRSFYFPYRCSGCQIDSQILLETGAVLSNLKAIDLPSVGCPSCGVFMQVDVDPDEYLAFFKT